MLKFEYCNAKTCTQELLALGNLSMKMSYIFEWLSTHDELRYGTQAEMVKLYVNNELVGYALFENFEDRTDKITRYKGKLYQDLGVVHFVTLPDHRKKGYATQLANALYEKIIAPILTRHQDVNSYVVATGLAAPIMARTEIEPYHLVQQFYSNATFEAKVVNALFPVS
jgi:GNAT superfamily N-acetyltransferase